MYLQKDSSSTSDGPVTENQRYALLLRRHNGFDENVSITHLRLRYKVYFSSTFDETEYTFARMMFN